MKISTEKKDLDIKFINDFISKSYWGKGRTIEETKKCIENSLNFGMYSNGEQIGYARVVTDFAIFAYILDVFITEKERGKGLSIKIMNVILNHTELKTIKKWKLTTSDAHGLYRKFGFDLIERPENLMERKRDIVAHATNHIQTVRIN